MWAITVMVALTVGVLIAAVSPSIADAKGCGAIYARYMLLRVVVYKVISRLERLAVARFVAV
jgi:hypothetical protein